MTDAHFDGEAFFAALDSHRQARRLTWKRVAEQSKVSASTLTRLAQGKRPDVDSLAALCAWGDLSADDYIRGKRPNARGEPLSKITAYLRADPQLSKEGAVALETLLKTAYERLRRD